LIFVLPDESNKPLLALSMMLSILSDLAEDVIFHVLDFLHQGSLTILADFGIIRVSIECLDFFW
jgi:hypothetical protein